MAQRKKRSAQRTKEEKNGKGLKVTDYLKGCLTGYYSRGKDYIPMTNLEWLQELAQEMTKSGIRVKILHSNKKGYKGYYALYRYSGAPIIPKPVLHKCGIPEKLWEVCFETKCYNRGDCKIYKGRSRADSKMSKKVFSDKNYIEVGSCKKRKSD